VSKIASLTSEEIKKLANTNTGENNYNLLINQLVEANVDYDQSRFEKIINNSFQQLGFENSVVNVFYPFFEKIGLLWMTERVSPAHEHFSSYLIQKKIIVAIDELQQRLESEQKILLFAPKGEHHEIPLLVMQYLLKKRGISTVYFGCNISISDVEYYCSYKQVNYLFVHLITNFLNQEPQAFIECLKSKFPAQKLVFSGPAFQEVNNPPEHITILRSCQEMMNFPGTI
jgi:methanogenic corrinoid protein MtbC1